MSRDKIPENVLRRLYAESMGRCMNPACQTELFVYDGDIIERAHLVPYCATADNSFENLVVLCPNCHTNFDKNHAFSVEDIKQWKATRKENIDRWFGKKFSTFEELQRAVYPLLAENKTLYERYYLGGNKKLWDSAEAKILSNNRALKTLLKNNLKLMQSHREKEYSNLEVVCAFLAHVDEFEATRLDEEKSRSILFPQELNSIFGIAPVDDSLLPSTESLETLINKLQRTGKSCEVFLGIPDPYVVIKDDVDEEIVYLKDTPRVRQLYHDYKCFRKTGVRLNSLNYALQYLHKRKIPFQFSSTDNLRELLINGQAVTFVYEYCLSKVNLLELAPSAGSMVVNLHNWNGSSCISKEAYTFSETMGVMLLTTEAYYEYFSGIRNSR